MRRAAIVAVGDEIAFGQKLDTNSRWLSARLAEAGWLAYEHVTLDDDDAAIARTIVRLAERMDLIVLTGGLGPTADDLTRGGLAAALGQELVEDPAALEQVRDYFRGRGRDMPERNRVQALRPPSARCLPNAAGTAPGLAAELGRAAIYCLPGPPAEMRPMFEAHLRPALGTGRSIATLVLQTVGLGESDVAQRLGELMDRSRRPLVGTTASGGVVSIRIRGEGQGQGEHEAVLETAQEVRRRLGPIVFAEAETPLADAVVESLGELGQTLATVESCTGGMLGQHLTAVTGVSAAYVGGWITYTNEMKHRQVGVPQSVFAGPGAVSRECALAMAAGGRERSGADHCLAITGIAGPGGGSEQKPVGTVWIALAGEAGAEARRFAFPGDRDAVRRWSVLSAMAMLRLRLVGHQMPLLHELTPEAVK